jgi:DNA polymerase-3 subunit delta'
MLFADIIGQAAIKERLIRSVKENKISHAQLFCGKEGIGKLPLAIAYAQYICCTDRKENDSCGVCPSCVKFNKLSHPDLHFVFPIVKQGSSATVCDNYINEWREIILERTYFSYNQWLLQLNAENKQATIYSNESEEISRKLSLKSYESEYKIMIIWQPEKMNEACGNKILKILEEPSDKTLFLLVTENPDAILTTILSRTQRINVPAIEIEDLSKALVEKFKISDEEAVNISRIANGSYIPAVENIEMSSENKENLDRFIAIMRLAYMKDVKGIKLWSEDMAKIGREQQKHFLAYAQRMIRENFILNFRNNNLNYMTKSEQDFSVKFSPFINERNIFDIMNEFALAERHIEQNVNSKMVFFDLSLKFIVLLKK